MKFNLLFKSKINKTRLSHARNLLAIATADGSISDTEIDLVTNICANYGLTPDDINRIIKNPDSIPIYFPESYAEKLEQLYDLVLMMMIDGKIYKREYQCCEIFAEKIDFGFGFNLVNQAIDDLRNAIEFGIGTDLALNRRKYFFEPFSNDKYLSINIIKGKYIDKMKMFLENDLRRLLTNIQDEINSVSDTSYRTMIFNAAGTFCRNVKKDYNKSITKIQYKIEKIGLTRSEYDNIVNLITLNVTKEFVDIPNDSFIYDDPDEFIYD